MILLISKLQYKNFEVGEFAEEKQRTFGETIRLIEQFPWEAQRERIVISLTNPSVTIHGTDNDYLKLALFYNGKFVLYYFDHEQTLFSKSFSDIKDTYRYINDWFDSSAFDYKDFKKELTPFQNNLKHFLSQDFRYEITPNSARKYLFATSSINLAFTCCMILLFLFSPSLRINAVGIAVLLATIFLIGGGLNLILFFNYYVYAKGKILIMSKGNDTFYFGDKQSLVKHSKAEIAHYTVHRVRNSKSPVGDFAVVTINLSSGGDIVIPNMLIEHGALENKLEGILKTEIGGFPLVNA